MRRKGMVSPSKAARLLGVCEATMRNWVRKYRAGSKSRLTVVDVNPITGWAMIAMVDINRIKRESQNH
jgi:transposase-like protein